MDWQEKLNQEGLRLTHPRRVIISLLEQANIPLSPQTIHQCSLDAKEESAWYLSTAPDRWLNLGWCGVCMVTMIARGMYWHRPDITITWSVNIVAQQSNSAEWKTFQPCCLNRIRNRL